MKAYAELFLAFLALEFLAMGTLFLIAVLSHLAGFDWFVVGDSEIVFVAGWLISASPSFMMVALIRAITRKIFKS